VVVISMLAVREEALAAEVLHGPEPVDVGGQPLEAGHQPPDVLPGPEVEGLLLRAIRPEPLVDPVLDERDERQQQEGQQPREHQESSRDRKAARPMSSTTPM
jgi:hypothetical protein